MLQLETQTRRNRQISSLMKDLALQFLRTALGRTDVEFRTGQWESIERLLKRRRILVVQRTGWGKSMVYFLATRLLRNEGAGLTLLISPLLSLMRNQLEAAAKIGVRAATINSSNREEWDNIEEELGKDSIDILLISPERLANEEFREKVLSRLVERVGLFVVDEAHCISDWGHDFRPDYRRIVRVLQAVPPNVPVLATTATANDRVVNDVMSQLGSDITLFRGPLIRESLKLQNVSMPSPAARMAWLAEMIPTLPGSGIVYALTQRDTERVAEWLRMNGVPTMAYHADIQEADETAPNREVRERQLLDNEVKVLVATVALGMGFDKPDLGFVIHFQRPASVVHYYQQVGRAGRAIDEAYGVLMHGEEDSDITEFFIRNAFPPQHHVEVILEALDRADEGLSIRELEKLLNIGYGELEKALRFLSVESPGPVTKIGSKWNLTAAASSYRIDRGYIDAITSIRRREQSDMDSYMKHTGCLMEFLGRALDDPESRPCGRCAGCLGEPILKLEYNTELANRAAIFLKRSHQRLEPRKQWPSGDAFPIHDFTGRIGAHLRAEEGRALCLWRDAGWGQLVATGKDQSGRFHEDLVDACVVMLRQWHPKPEPTWTTCIPSLRHPGLVPEFAERLATALELPFHTCMLKMKENRPQKEMQNSFQQARNLDGVFAISEEDMHDGPCILVDDVRDSGWTFTVVAALLRKAGCESVVPLALALNLR